MKKLILSSAVFTLMLTGCLKDEDFDNQEYGTQIVEAKAVSFPLASSDGVSVAVVPQTTPQSIMTPVIALEAPRPYGSDVNVTLQINDALVAADSNLTLLPPTEYTVSLTQTIKAGQMFDSVEITFLNTSQLDLNLTYGIGISIVSADNGFQVASNSKDVLLKIAVKNNYDGIYSVESGLVTRYSAPGVPLGDALSGPLDGNPDIHIVTIDPTTSTIPIPGTVGALYWSGGTSQVAGIDGVTITVDPATNEVTMASDLNATLTNWAGHPNYYDPATKTFYLAFRWNPTANVREYEVVLKYQGPR